MQRRRDERGRKLEIKEKKKIKAGSESKHGTKLHGTEIEATRTGEEK